MTKEERDAILNRKMSDKEVADRISEPAGDIYTKPSISDQFLSYLDEEIKRFSRLAANERGNEYHRFDGHRAAYIKAKEKLLQLLKNQINESKG